VGLGTWQAPLGEVSRVLSVALDLGYRHIDCASRYDNEKEIGEALAKKIGKNGLKREDLYIVSKLWNNDHAPEDVLPACKKTLSDLQLDYLDLYLVHWPIAFKRGDNKFPTKEDGSVDYGKTPLEDTWKAMENLVRKGLVKEIGLSNFNSKQIDRMIKCSTIPPTCLQVEVTPYLNQEKLFRFCEKRKISVVAFSPLGTPHRPWGLPSDPVLLEDKTLLSLAKKYKKTPAQIALRFQVQRGIAVIPKSSNSERLKENFEITKWKLKEEDMETLFKLNRNFRYCHPYFTNKQGIRTPEIAEDHPENPFVIEF